jgi:hypothetical protein
LLEASFTRLVLARLRGRHRRFSVWIVAQFYLPGKGFTFFATFGDKMQERYLPELKAINYYSQENGWGYDAQYYAQLAMRPRLSDPALAQALDSLPYRARRILLSWTAWLLGGGDPVRALQVFSLQNVVAWLLLAALLWRWFPPTNCENFFRWGGVLFSAGLIWSVRGALLDGPSLLLIAVGVALAEAGRPWWSAVVLGVSGLAKETNLLAGAALAPAPQEVRRDWRGLAGRAGLLVLPLALWLVCLWVWLGTVGDSGARNFGLPLMAYLAKWRETLQLLRVDGLESFERFNVPVLVALLVQTLFFLLRPRWRETWWRIGAAYAVLMIFLGAAVWEGYPSAAVRVLLPMQLAFNIAVPRGGRGWLVLLLLGNLTLFSTPDLLKPPGRESYRVEGPRALRMVEGTGRTRGRGLRCRLVSGRAIVLGILAVGERFGLVHDPQSAPVRLWSAMCASVCAASIPGTCAYSTAGNWCGRALSHCVGRTSTRAPCWRRATRRGASRLPNRPSCPATVINAG